MKSKEGFAAIEDYIVDPSFDKNSNVNEVIFEHERKFKIKEVDGTSN